MADFKINGKNVVTQSGVGEPALASNVTLAAGTIEANLTAPLSHRNMIINGAMQVSQRSIERTSITATGYYTVDRMHTQFTNGGTWTIAQSTDAPVGFSNSFRMDCTATASMGSANDFVGCMQKIEAQNLQHLAYGTASAKAMVMSFWVKSNKTGTYAIMFYTPDGGRIVGANYTISAGDTWEYKTITIPADTGGTMNNDNGEGFRALFYLATGTGRTSGTARTSWSAYALADEAVGHNVNVADNTANDWSITGVQLELGSTATPFEHRSYGDELARCQRYYAIMPTQFGQPALGDGSTNGALMLTVPVPLRHTPAIEQINSIDHRIYKSGYVGSTSNHIGFNSYSADTCFVKAAFAGFSSITLGHTYTWVAVGSYKLGINAEL